MSPGDTSQALTTGRCILGHVDCALAASVSSGVCKRCRIQVAPDLLDQDLHLTSPRAPRDALLHTMRRSPGRLGLWPQPHHLLSPIISPSRSPTPHQQLTITSFSQRLLQETPPKTGVEGPGLSAPETLTLSRNHCPQLPAHPECKCSGLTHLTPASDRWKREASGAGVHCWEARFNLWHEASL